ncbi:MAG: HTTM domain-containing protein [Bacteroidota bacterium]
MNSLLDRLLFRKVDASGLAIFRILFGLVMLWEMIYFMRIDFVELFFGLPDVRFSYGGLSFLQPLPEGLMWALIVLLTACCVLIVLGKWYRPAMLTFAIGFSYIFFLEKSYYNNHLYLICLLAFMLFFIRADKALSLDAKGKTERDVPMWMYNLLKFQVVVVYFYGGLAKINSDWLINLEPARTLVEGTFLDGLLGLEFATRFISYGGMLFDLSVGFLLLFRKTRLLGFLGAAFFNVSNAIIFNDINIFPYFMLGALILFADPEWTKAQVERFFPAKKVKGKKMKRKVVEKEMPRQRLLIVLGVYAAFQLLFPFRHWLIPGNVEWTGESQRFSWRMKIQHRATEEMEFQVLNYDTKTIVPVNMDAYQLNRDQKVHMGIHPEMVWQFAQFLEERAKKKLRARKVGVNAKVKVAFNGRPAKYMIDPQTDLAEEDWKLMQHNEWILPLED